MSAALSIVGALKATGVDTRALYQNMSRRSILSAAREQGLSDLLSSSSRIVPDLTDQYTYSIDPDEYRRYWEIKLRALHAFQVQSTLDAIELVEKQKLVIVDIGDSSGNHGAYLRAMAPNDRIERVVSVNMDPVAVQKIKDRSGEAILVRAEELDLDALAPDFLMCFETLEHLTDPLRFLHRLAENPYGKRLIVSVPYRRVSRFGGRVLDFPPDRMPPKMTPEELHIFELNPLDWSRLAQLAGDETGFSRIYLQYPKYGLLRAMKPIWRRLDFEGFLCLYLNRNDSVSMRYTGW